MDLSVIIVNWNAKDHLRECLKSVIEESRGSSYEVWVVDNASSDGSCDMLKAEFSQVRLIENVENVGFSKANNQAIEQSKGKYIALLNPDCVVLDGGLKKMLDFMEKHPDVGAAGGKTLNPEGKIHFFHSSRRFPTPFSKFCHDVRLDRILPRLKFFGGFSMIGWDRNDEREVDAISGAFFFVRRDAIRDAGLLDERFFLLAEDLDWCRRIRQKEWKIMFNPEAEVIHFGGTSIDRVRRTRLENDIRSHLLYFWKHHGRFACFSFRILSSLTHFMKTLYWISRVLYAKNRKISLKNAVSHFRAIFYSLTVSVGTKRR